MDCKRPECIKEWEECVSDEEENAEGYCNGSYTFVHCEMDDCHCIYPKGKNGYTCEICETEVCEPCGDDGKWGKYDEFYCGKDCYQERKKC